MVDTRRLQQLLNTPGATTAVQAPPAGKLALSGHRDMRLSGRPKAPSAQRIAKIAHNWSLMDAARKDPQPKSRLRQFNALARDQHVIRQFDILRTQILQAFRTRNHTVLGICAPQSGSGASFTSAGLLASLARRGDVSVVGLDLNLRAPRLHSYFELVADQPLMPLLSGEIEVESHLKRITERVALGMNAQPLDYLQGSAFSGEDLGEVLTEISDILAPDIVICDLPPLSDGDMAMTMAPQMDGVLLVADGKSTQSEDVIAAERLLQEHTDCLGAILNRHVSPRFQRRAPKS